MTRIERFEDLLSWQEARSLSISIYKIFRFNKDYGFKDQIQRAVISIGNNIAEGFERHTNAEFKQFLYIAKGSSAEVRSMIDIGYELGYVEKADAEELAKKCNNIAKLISGLIKKL